MSGFNCSKLFKSDGHKSLLLKSENQRRFEAGRRQFELRSQRARGASAETGERREEGVFRPERSVEDHLSFYWLSSLSVSQG